MKRILLMFAALWMIAGNVFSQCTTTNATGCQCQTSGSTNCDLLPDIIVGRPPLLVSGTNGVIEYFQTGNAPNDGRLRVSVSSPNIGHGPLEIRTTSTYICGTDTLTGTAPATCPNTGLPPKQLIKQRVYHKNGNTMTYWDRDAGSMTYHPTHGHMHVDDWGIYTLRTSNGDPNPLNWPIIGTGAKLAFCLMDYGSCSTYNGHCVDSLGNTLVNTSFPNYGLGGGAYSCSPTVQGISSGYTDIYYQSLDGMWINIPPGTCNGQYFIVVQLDPYNYFLEEKETNNVIVVPYTLTKQSGTTPTVSASGPTSFCPGGSVTLTSSAASSYLWSNGATTQSITVSQSGNYTVTTDAGSACPGISATTNVAVQSIPVTAIASDSSICAGQSIVLSGTVTTPQTTSVQTSFSNNTTISIPDNNATGVLSPVTVSGISPATLSGGALVSVRVNITHPYVGDLILSLISPSGTTVTLCTQRGGSGDNFVNTVFTMSATTSISSGAAPFTGNFIPDGNIAGFTGNANGTWQLKVADVAASDIGSITSWTLTINNVVPATLTYAWTSNPSGFSSSSVSASASPAISTGYNLLVTNTANGCTGSDSVNVAVQALPTTPSTLNGPALVCVGTTLNYYVTNNPNVSSYNWSAPAGATIVSGQGTNSVNVYFSNTFTTGTICLSTLKGECWSLPKCKTLTKHTAIQPTAIQGELSGNCVTNSGSVWVSPVNYATSYNWIVPSGVTILSGQGTTAITFSTAPGFSSGTISVTSSNGCMNSVPRNGTLFAAPAKPVISGPASVCANQTGVLYNATSSYGATYYSWSGPTGSLVASGQGTTAIGMNFGTASGNVNCNAKNACGSRGIVSYAVAMPCRDGVNMEGSMQLSLIPNPANASTVLQISGGVPGKAVITVCNLLGQEKMRRDQYLNGDDSINFDIRTLPAGIYLVNVNNGNSVRTIRLTVE